MDWADKQRGVGVMEGQHGRRNQVCPRYRGRTQEKERMTTEQILLWVLVVTSLVDCTLSVMDYVAK